MIHYITLIKPLPEFRLLCVYNTGEEVEFNMEPLITHAIASPDGFTEKLANELIFNQVFLDSYGAPVWPNGFDLCPDTIYQQGQILSLAKSA